MEGGRTLGGDNMTIEFTGTAKCASERQLEEVVRVLRDIPSVAVSADELSIIVYYSENENVDTDRTIARLSHIIEGVKTHGISIMSKE